MQISPVPTLISRLTIFSISFSLKQNLFKFKVMSGVISLYILLNVPHIMSALSTLYTNLLDIVPAKI